jgi:hypothetical protein
METIIRHVRDLGTSERTVIEQLVGHALGENQQLVIQVFNPEQRLHLAEDLLRSLPRTADSEGLQGVPVENVRGVAAGAGPAPDDDTARRWVEEYQAEKYG